MNGYHRNVDKQVSRLWLLLVGSVALWIISIVTLISKPDVFLSTDNKADGVYDCKPGRKDGSLIVLPRRQSNNSPLLDNNDNNNNNNNNNKDIEQESLLPRVAWLMSFPNSGTSYTLRIVGELSNRSTASNYGEEHLDVDSGRNVLLHNNPRGPVRSLPLQELPTSYILTKTHCGSRCVPCSPQSYLETQRSFQRACLETHLVTTTTTTANTATNNNDNTTLSTTATPTEVRSVETLHYSKDLVGRAVHLVRNPLDNVVSRFHLSRQHSLEKTNSSLANNATGFHEWCRELDHKHTSKERRHLDPELLRLWRDVPCHAQFFEYVQWHNLAYTTTTEYLNIPLLVLRYEDYKRDWDGTVQSLMEFLQLDAGDLTATPFDMSTYHDTYYTESQKVAIRQMMESLASVPIWEIIQVYFG